MTSEIGWLVECRDPNMMQPEWWNGYAWTRDANTAIRLARKQDADAIIATDPLVFQHASATEHMWGVQPEIDHRCGVRGFDHMKGDICPACVAARRGESQP